MKFTVMFATLAISMVTAGAAEFQEQKDRDDTPVASPKCAYYPCPNTATGEEPQDIAVREGKRHLEALAKTDSDKKRWLLPLYSSETESTLLELDIVKAAGFRMRLIPKKGHLRFEHRGGVDVFEIEQPIDSKRTLCPDYTIKIIDASAEHAVIRKLCIEYEYKPNRYSAGATFYLYDIATHTMRSFMESRTAVKDDAVLFPKSNPSIVKLKDGFDVRWKASFPSNGAIFDFSINNRYQRTSSRNKAGKLELICSDMAAPKDERVESGSCEGGGVLLVSSSTR